jgi:hypothetical protein
MASLIPVSQWVYNLYKVSYWFGDPALAESRKIRSTHIAASCENHLNSSVWDLEYAPRDAEYMTYELVRENVEHPRVIGQMYGQSVYENGHSHGERLAQQM